MSELNLTFALIGLLVLSLAVVSDFIKQYVSVLSEPLLAVGYGVVIGPVGLGLLSVANWGDPMVILEQVSRVTLGIAVMNAAIRLPTNYVFDRWKTMTAVLLVIMPGTWLVSGLVTNAFFGLPWWIGIVIGAVLTPTDPVIAGTIVTGTAATENIPDRLRNYVTAESAINDGVAYLFLFFPLLMLEHSPSAALREWFLVVLLKEVVLAVLVGFAAGYVVGYVQDWTTARGYTVKASVLGIVIALTFTVLGGVKLFGADGILAVFAAGVAFQFPTAPGIEDEQTEVQETFERLFEMPVFVIFGMMLPWGAWGTLGWWGVLFAATVILVRRLPVVVPSASLLSPLRDRTDTLFVGWFGPIGIAAVFYATVVVHETGSQRVWEISSLVIAVSILAYGVTSTPFTKLYGEIAK